MKKLKVSRREGKQKVFVGLDVHKAFIQIAVPPVGDQAAVDLRLPHTDRGVSRLVRKLVEKHPEAHFEVCYEAGPTGYQLARKLNALENFSCQVIAPALIPRKAGERVKTDRRDARKLAEYHAAGLLTEVRPPSPEQEGLRELSRARETARDDLRVAKQRLSKFLLRQARHYPGKTAWTNMHREWLTKQRFEDQHLQLTFDAFVRALEQSMSRLEELDRHLEEASQCELIAEPVALVKCLKGISTVTAVVLVTELYSFERFAHPNQLMSFLGMTPSEHSTGGNPNRGGITKAGNGRIRKLCTEAAWNCSRSNKAGLRVLKRREGQPGWAVDIAERAQVRLYKRFQYLTHRGKHRNVAAMACGRELVGFIWAILSEHHARQVGLETAA